MTPDCGITGSKSRSSSKDSTSSKKSSSKILTKVQVSLVTPVGAEAEITTAGILRRRKSDPSARIVVMAKLIRI